MPAGIKAMPSKRDRYLPRYGLEKSREAGKGIPVSPQEDNAASRAILRETKGGILPARHKKDLAMIRRFQRFIEHSPWDDELSIIFDWMGWPSALISILLIVYIIVRLKALWG